MKRALFDMFLGTTTSRNGWPDGNFDLSTTVVGADLVFRKEGGAAAAVSLILTGLLDADLVCTMAPSYV